MTPATVFYPSEASIAYLITMIRLRHGVVIPRSEARQNLEGGLFFKAIWGEATQQLGNLGGTGMEEIVIAGKHLEELRRRAIGSEVCPLCRKSPGCQHEKHEPDCPLKRKEPEIDTFNKFGVSLAHDKIAIMKSMPARLTKAEAFLLAAYLVCLARCVPGDEDFDKVLAAIQNA
jgi:hypothetical protein